jgi:hypothetical protein
MMIIIYMISCLKICLQKVTRVSGTGFTFWLDRGSLAAVLIEPNERRETNLTCRSCVTSVGLKCRDSGLFHPAIAKSQGKAGKEGLGFMSVFSLTTEKQAALASHHPACGIGSGASRGFPRLIARVADVPRLMHGVDDLVEIVASGSLQRREGPVGLDAGQAAG